MADQRKDSAHLPEAADAPANTARDIRGSSAPGRPLSPDQALEREALVQRLLEALAREREGQLARHEVGRLLAQSRELDISDRALAFALVPPAGDPAATELERARVERLIRARRHRARRRVTQRDELRLAHPGKRRESTSDSVEEVKMTKKRPADEVLLRKTTTVEEWLVPPPGTEDADDDEVEADDEEGPEGDEPAAERRVPAPRHRR